MIKQYNQYIYKDGQWLLVGVSDQNNFITYVLQKDGDTITLKGDDNSTSDVVIKEFSDEAKAKLENIAAGAQVNVLEGVKVNGTKLTIDGEKLVDISVPTKLSQLTNDADYVADANYVHTDNNYTTAEKNKLAGIAASADVNTIEQIKVNNSALTPDGNKIVNITVPTKLTDLTNDNNFVTDANYVHTDNNYTTAEKNKLAGLSNYDDTEIKQQIAQAGKIDTIKVNGTAQPVVDKTVSLTIPTVPTNISAFTNDKNYQTEDEVTSLIADAVGEIQTLEYSVVGSLPATGETGVIYLVSNGGANPNIYDEYIYINENFEKIGTTEIDLSGYLTKTEAGETYARKAEVIQSDWSQNDSNQLDYVKNRTHYEIDNVVSNVIISNKECAFTTAGIGDAFSEMEYVYTEEELAKINSLQDGPATIKVSINGHNFESAIEISNKTFTSDMIRISTIDPNLYFIIISDSKVVIGYEINGEGNYTINLIIEQNNKEVIKLDKKFLPDEVVLQDELVQSDWNQNDETAIDYVKNRTHYAIINSDVYPVALEQDINYTNSSYAPTTVESLDTLPEELYTNYSSLLVTDIQNGNYLPIVIRITIGDTIVDFNGTVKQQWTGWGISYYMTLKEQITDINISEIYPYIRSLGSGLGGAPIWIFFTSAEEAGQYPIVKVKEEVLVLEKEFKTLDREYLPYYRGINHAEAFNNSNTATGNYSHAEGYNTEATGNFAHAEGGESKASGGNSHAEGRNTIANGMVSHAEGSYTVAYNEYSHVEGNQSVAFGRYSHAEGSTGEYILKDYSVVSVDENSRKIFLSEWDDDIRKGYEFDIVYPFGVSLENTIIVTDINENEKSITIGPIISQQDMTNILSAETIRVNARTVSAGETSHAEGAGTYAGGKASHAEGTGTIATADSQHVQGRYNIEDTENKYAHIVGNGYMDEDSSHNDFIVRSNAHTLDWDGNAWYSGKITAGADPVNAMDLVTKQYLENNSSSGGVYFKGAFATDDTEINNSENILNENDANYETELQEVLATPGNVMFHVVDKSLNNIPE